MQQERGDSTDLDEIIPFEELHPGDVLQNVLRKAARFSQEKQQMVSLTFNKHTVIISPDIASILETDPNARDIVARVITNLKENELLKPDQIAELLNSNNIN